MQTWITRHRNFLILLLVVFLQILMVGYQVKTGEGRLLRLWAVTLTGPALETATAIHSSISSTARGFLQLREQAERARKLEAEVHRLQVENQHLRARLMDIEQLVRFQQYLDQSPQKLLPARIIGRGTEPEPESVFIDRGASDGVKPGMGVIVPQGIVGRVVRVFPTVSQVLLATSPNFASGVVTGKHQAFGVLKGSGAFLCEMRYVPGEQEVEPSEPVYTSGFDRVFPRGLPVGWVKTVEPGNPFLKVTVELAALRTPLEYVLVILEGVHQALPRPEEARPFELSFLVPPQEDSEGSERELSFGALTDADRLYSLYQEIGELLGHTYGEGLPGSKPPEFNSLLAPGAQRQDLPAAQAGSNKLTPEPRQEMNQAGSIE